MSARNRIYDIFLSYRRDGGAETAKHLRDTLTERGYSVFLDVESLRAGAFNTELYRVIEHCTDFLLILPQNGLDRCADEGDWIRLEIEHAKKNRKNIVPIMLKGFEFPETLPESIDFIRTQNGPIATDMAYYDAYVDRLMEFLQSKPWPKWKRRATAISTLTVAVVITVIVYFCSTTYPLTASQSNLVSSLISYMILNLNQVDLAGARYVKELDRSISYVEGKTTDSSTDVQYEMRTYSKEIRKRRDFITSLPDQLRSQLMKTKKFDVGELDAFRTVLIDQIDEYVENIDYIRYNIIGNENLRTEYIVEYLSFLEKMAELDAEMLFYQLNETLLPVTNEKALTDLKNDMLPQMTFLYSGRWEFTHDREALAGKEEAVFQQYEALITRYGESADKEKAYLDEKHLMSRMEKLIKTMKERGKDTSVIEAWLQSIRDEQQKLEETKTEVIKKEKELKQKKNELYEKFKPLEEDSQATLWGKGIKFLTVNMPEAAEECFAIYVKNADDSQRIYGTSAKKFAQNYAVLREEGIEGGVVVCLYEEGRPRQAVELGDIIYAVDGNVIHNFSEYSAASEGEETCSINILRFTDSGYELVESVVESELGKIGMQGLIEE